MRARVRLVASLALLTGWVTAGVTLAQDSGNTGAGDNNNTGSTSVDTGGGNVINITTNQPGPSTETTVTDTPPVGFPSPDTDLEEHLPSSSHARSDINEQDGFDLNSGSGNQSTTVKGNADAMGVGLGRRATPQIPEMHTVRKGDTLWDLCASYFNNPWMWPKVWSQNAQLQNPHWIYPGDQLRLREPGEAPSVGQTLTLGSGSGVSLRRATVPRTTVFLRNVGYIDDPDNDIWGELVGAEQPQQLLAEGNKVYMIMRPGVSLRIGQLLTVFEPGRKVDAVKGARVPPGSLVKFKGAIKVTRWDPNKRMATGILVESLDSIERGAKIGQIGRRFDIVPPRPSVAEVQARVLTSMYPHEIMGKDQVLFIDRGTQDGLVAGNRLFVLRRGDTWRQGLYTAGSMVRLSMKLDDPSHVPTDMTPFGGNDDDFPVEVVGELRVIRAHKYSALALVTAAQVEIEPGDQAVTRKGE